MRYLLLLIAVSFGGAAFYTNFSGLARIACGIIGVAAFIWLKRIKQISS